MFKLMCFLAPATIAVWLKHNLLKEEYKLVTTILEWVVFCIVINLLVIITVLPFGSVIINNCDAGHFHIQYGKAAIVMTTVYSIFVGIIGSFISLSRENKRGSNE